MKDAVDLVGARRPSAPTCGGSAASGSGLCPFHDERTPSFSVDPVKKVYYCFGCGEKGDVFGFVQKTQGARLRARRSSSCRSARTSSSSARRRIRRRRSGGRSAGPAAGAARRARRSSTRAYLWKAAEAEPAREYLAERGLEQAVLEEFQVGLRAGRGRQADPAGGQGGLLGAGPGHGRAGAAAWRAGRGRASAGASSSRWRTSAGACSGSPGARCARDRAEVPEHVREQGGRLLQGPAALRDGQGANARDEDRSVRGRRGLHGRARAAPGRRPGVRGDHGHLAHRSAARRADARPGDGLPRARCRQRRQERDVARGADGGATARPSCASSRCRAGATRRRSSRRTGRRRSGRCSTAR